MNEAKLARAIALLDDLVRFPTISAESNLDLIDYLRAVLNQIGVASTPVFNEARTKANLVATLGPKNRSGGILFSGHTDVVPVAGQAWSSDPFRMIERDGKFFGRGTCDMKGFIACVIAEAESLAETPLARPYQMVFSFDEEIGCVGVRRVIDNFDSFATRPALILVGEPTLMQPVIGHKGKLAGRVTCIGHECHSSHAPDGVNAIHLAADMVTSLRKMQSDLFARTIRDDGFSIPVSTVHVGMIEGGTALNIVPRQCTLDFEIRNIPADDPDLLLNQLFDEAHRLSHTARDRFAECGVSIEITNRYPGLMIPPDDPELQRLQSILGTPRAEKISFGTEGGLFRDALGVSTLVCGPGDIAQAHKPDEFVSRDQMALCLATLEQLSSELRA